MQKRLASICRLVCALLFCFLVWSTVAPARANPADDYIATTWGAYGLSYPPPRLNFGYVNCDELESPTVSYQTVINACLSTHFGYGGTPADMFRYDLGVTSNNYFPETQATFNSLASATPMPNGSLLTAFCGVYAARTSEVFCEEDDIAPLTKPKLWLDVTTGNAASFSLSGEPTAIQATVTLASTAPNPGSSKLIATIPVSTASSLTLTGAAQSLGYTGFNWVQLVDIPSPSGAYATNNGTNPVVGLSNDGPPSGWAALQHDPATVGWASYPYYYQADASSAFGYSLVANQTSPTTLNFFDSPADPCLPPVSGIGGYPNSPFLLGTDPSICRSAMPADPGSVESFQTELVGMIASGSACPANGGICYEQDAGNNGNPTAIEPGAICSFSETCYETLVGADGLQSGYFFWNDSFNGYHTVNGHAFGGGGIGYALGNLSPVDPTTGAGGITLISVDGIPVSNVPEPHSWYLMVLPTLLTIRLAKAKKSWRITAAVWHAPTRRLS